MKGQDIFILLKLVSLERQITGLQKNRDTSYLTIHSDSNTHEIIKYNRPDTLGIAKEMLTKPQEDWNELIVDGNDSIEHGEAWEGWQIDEVDQAPELLSDSTSPPEIANLYSARGLSATLGVSKTEVHNSIKRSTSVGLVYLDRKTKHPRANKKILLNLIVHGIKYIFPAVVSTMMRGIPTSFSSPALEKHVETAGDLIYVWPDPRGKKMGQSVKPLFPTVPFAVRQDRILYEYLALIDAIRLGNAREVNLAKLQLEKGLI
ncbi:MAG: hypothetical protein GY799_33515 [Desulfobulbaceae bacterium]|nr:hypothetical protein [Desulfobulbaceae bacterium]